jgi:hypothetical protein
MNKIFIEIIIHLENLFLIYEKKQSISSGIIISK